MPSSLEKLPFEIVNTIFRHIERKWYYRNLFVSRQWHSLVKPIFYRELKMSTYHFEQFLQLLSRGQHNSFLFQNFSFTTKLVMSDYGYFDESKVETFTSTYSDDEIMYLLSHFKSLKVFNFQRTMYRNIFFRILDAYVAEQFPHLEEIETGPLSSRSFSIYNKYRQKLRRISLMLSSNSDYARQVLDMLPGFRNLTQLCILNGGRVDVPFVNALQSCPNLSFFEYYSDKICPQGVFTPLQNISYDQQTSLRNNLKNLKILKLRISMLSGAYINFFLDYFPENLELLAIEMKNYTFYQWIKETTLDLVLQFVARISNVKKIMIETGEEDPERDNLPRGSPSKLDMFYQTLSILKGNNNWTECTASYITFWDNSTKISVNNSHLIYRYFLNTEDYDLNPDDFYEPEYSDGDDPITYSMYPVPTPSHSWICGPQIINNLNFRFENEDMKEFPFYYFDYARKYCFQLATFRLYYNNNEKCSVFAKQEEGVRSTLLNMTYVTYNQRTHSQYTLNRLLAFFPNVKTLKYFARMNSEAIYDLTQFQHLKTFTIDIEEKIKSFGSKNIFLDVEIVGKNLACFEISDQSKNGKPNYMLKPRTVGKHYDPNVRKYAFCIKCLPSLEKIKISKLAPLFNLAKYSSLRLKPSAIAGSSDIPIDLT